MYVLFFDLHKHSVVTNITCTCMYLNICAMHLKFIYCTCICTSICLPILVYFTINIIIVFFQSKLAINPLALSPGAAPPTATPTEKAVSFEEPIQVKTLSSLTKV